jgi:hypothetical protein
MLGFQIKFVSVFDVAAVAFELPANVAVIAYGE